MKISDLLCQYLYQNKELVLEGFGVFHLDPSVNPNDTKEPQQVYQGITFEDNPKIKTPSDLIDFLVQNSGKMKPLAISDLEAFLTTGRELLNIGKPLILNGIGTLTGYRTLEFTPGPFTPMRLDGKDTHFRERVATSEDELFAHDDSGHSRTTSPQGRALIITLAGLVVLLLVGYGVYSHRQHQPDPARRQQCPCRPKGYHYSPEDRYGSCGYHSGRACPCDPGNHPCGDSCRRALYIRSGDSVL
jgi:hypothetical protein